VISACLVVFISCHKQSEEGNDVYNFPIRPGTSQWMKFTSLDEKLKACQIPDSILKDISTKGLIETVINYPLLMNYVAYNTPQSGVEAIETQFNGLSELLDREDSSKSLFNFYKETNPSKEELTWYNAGQIAFIEALLSQDVINSRFSDDEIYELILETKNRYENKPQSEKWSANKYTVWLMGKALQKSEYEPFESEVKNNSTLKSFLDKGFYLDKNMAKIIYDYADDFVLKYKK
jgi:hypothetical protein